MKTKGNNISSQQNNRNSKAKKWAQEVYHKIGRRISYHCKVREP